MIITGLAVVGAVAVFHHVRKWWKATKTAKPPTKSDK